MADSVYSTIRVSRSVVADLKDLQVEMKVQELQSDTFDDVVRNLIVFYKMAEEKRNGS